MIILAVLAVTVVLLSNISLLGAANTQVKDVSLSNAKQFAHYTVIDQSTGNATSSDVRVSGADKVELYFTRNDGAFVAGQATSTFLVQVSPDGTNWYWYNKLISNVTNSNSQDKTRVGSVTIETSTSTVLYALDLENDTFHSVRCIANHASTTLDPLANNTCAVSVVGAR